MQFSSPYVEIVATNTCVQAANGVISSCDVLADLLESIEHFVSRLKVYTEIIPMPSIDKKVVDLIVELISTLALVTRKLNQRRSRESLLAEVCTLLNVAQSSWRRIILRSRTSRRPGKDWTGLCEKRLGIPQPRSLKVKVSTDSYKSLGILRIRSSEVSTVPKESPWKVSWPTRLGIRH